jgi:preprotein translocase subunit YajC
MTYDQAAELVISRATQAQLARLHHARKVRTDLLRDLRALQVTVGCTAEVQTNISPKKLAGLRGVVLAIHDEAHVELQLDEQSAARAGSRVGPDRALSGMPLAALANTAPDEDFARMLAYLLCDANPEQAEQLMNNGHARRKQLSDDLAPGATVVLAGIGNPKFLNGLRGTVASVHADRFGLRLDAKSTNSLRYHGRNERYTVPDGTTEYVVPNIPTSFALIVPAS